MVCVPLWFLAVCLGLGFIVGLMVALLIAALIYPMF